LTQILGIHHVTAIAGDAQENLDFYSGVLGMRLVKKSVNQDDPGTYHLFFADAAGTPGTDLTFFPWPGARPARHGTGLAVEVSLAVRKGSHAFWAERLRRAGVTPGPVESRFGEAALPFTDPHGLAVALVELEVERAFEAWQRSSVPVKEQIRGLHAVRIAERDIANTRAFLGGAMGFSEAGEADGWRRFAVAGGGSGAVLDVREAPDLPRGTFGPGGIHHVAWRVADDAAQRAVRERVLHAGRRPTEMIDRFWFHSVYFTEPGGALFELATEGPGFAVDESPERLGEALVLPPWLEPLRSRIEDQLPQLALR
jgi:glyoxalase family protein